MQIYRLGTTKSKYLQIYEMYLQPENAKLCRQQLLKEQQIQFCKLDYVESKDYLNLKKYIQPQQNIYELGMSKSIYQLTSYQEISCLLKQQQDEFLKEYEDQGFVNYHFLHLSANYFDFDKSYIFLNPIVQNNSLEEVSCSSENVVYLQEKAILFFLLEQGLFQEAYHYQSHGNLISLLSYFDFEEQSSLNLSDSLILMAEAQAKNRNIMNDITMQKPVVQYIKNLEKARK